MKPVSPSSAAPTWEEVTRNLRAYCLAKYQAEPVSIQITLANAPGVIASMPQWGAVIPSAEGSEGEPTIKALTVVTEAPLSEGDPQALKPITLSAVRRIPDQFSDDFQIVNARGVTFHLTPMQARVVRALKEALDEGVTDMSQEDLLKAAGSDGVKLCDLFKRSNAWNNLIVSVHRGYYRLGVGLELNSAG